MDLTSATWRKSSYSGGNGGNCVEVAVLAGGRRAVRDSKDPAGGPDLQPSRVARVHRPAAGRPVNARASSPLRKARMATICPPRTVTTM